MQTAIKAIAKLYTYHDEKKARRKVHRYPDHTPYELLQQAKESLAKLNSIETPPNTWREPDAFDYACELELSALLTTLLCYTRARGFHIHGLEYSILSSLPEHFGRLDDHEIKIRNDSLLAVANQDYKKDPFYGAGRHD